MVDTWQPVALDTTWLSFVPGAVLFYTDDQAVVCDARTGSTKQKVRVQRPNGEQFLADVKEGDPLGKLAKKLLEDDDDIRAIALPAIMWHEDALLAPRNLVGLGASVAFAVLLTLVMAWWGNFSLTWVVISGSVAVGMLARRAFKGGRLSFMAPQRLGLTMDTIHAYALTREQGRLWVPPSRGANRRQLAFQRVDAIRAHYLSKREDIVYRIESSALFDPAVPATAAFEKALVAFDDVRDDTPIETVDALANDVELTFNTAEANAERLGYLHLPEGTRDSAGRAAKAARLAAGASTEGERIASLTQVKRILDSLALHHLPAIDERPAIEAPRR